jgi:hypothetical protein
MKHVMPHDLSPELAKQAAEKAFDAYREKYSKFNPGLRWLNDTRAEASFSAKGIGFKGNIELKPKAIEFDLDVPFVFRPFKGKAIAIMERELAHWTGKAKNGELG